MTGLLLAGIGNVGQDQKKNFLVVDSSTSRIPQSQIQADMIILLIPRNPSSCDRASLRGVHDAEGHCHPPDQPARTSFVLSRLSLVLPCIYSLSQVAEKIRPMVDKYQAAFPALLEIPSKDHPYGVYILPLTP